jgi:ribonuclease Y
MERVSNMTRDEAAATLLANIEVEVREQANRMVRQIETEAKETADERARRIITASIQRWASDQVSESSVSVVPLPSEEMKGRIIGREGRNIRALEMATGIDLIIDDTPEAVILSGFDPVRREIARQTLLKLIQDGRIHPARIEEMVEKSRAEVDTIIKEEGERAAFEAGVHGLNPDLLKSLGRLHFRFSMGQNVLKHSVEVAHLCAILAAELGADVTVARKAGLLHDLGKGVSHEVEGPHALIGADIAKRLGQPRRLCTPSPRTTLRSNLRRSRPFLSRLRMQSPVRVLEHVVTRSKTTLSAWKRLRTSRTLSRVWTKALRSRRVAKFASW